MLGFGIWSGPVLAARGGWRLVGSLYTLYLVLPSWDRWGPNHPSDPTSDRQDDEQIITSICAGILSLKLG